MDAAAITAELARRYPGKRIVLLPPEEPVEIICELSATGARGRAIAVVDHSAPHFHKHTTEVYNVLSGSLSLHVDGTRYVLKEGDIFTIKPGQVHYVEGNAVWVAVETTPPWSADDHILADRT